MRIGILGGSFDPPHRGHLELGRAAQAALTLDEVLFIPARRNPLKAEQPIADPKHRLAMVQLLVAGEPRFAVSDQELRRGGASYAIDTLDELHAIRRAEYWLILGLDAAIGFKKWKAWQRLLKLTRLAVANRSNDPDEVAMARIPEDLRPWVDFVPMPRNEASSSEVRYRHNTSRPLGDLVPPEIVKYIESHGLYRS